MSGRFLLAGCLLVVSLMWPSEGAINGDGLHWAILWLAAAAFGCWRVARRSEDGLPLRQGWRNVVSRLSPFVIVAGVWISTFHVFQIQADRRSALNVAFEWSAILAASVLFWQFPAAIFRQHFGRLMVGVALGVAIMGIVQHHVVWEQRADWYLERMAAIEHWEQTGSGAAGAKQAEQDLLAEQVPLAGSAAETFRRRLLDSSEAIGPFALANTLGGFLAVGMVLLAGILCVAFNGVNPTSLVEELPSGDVTSADAMAKSTRRGKWTNFILPLVWAILIGYALVLTKSRTAWVATGVGILMLLNGVRRNRFGIAVTEQQADRTSKDNLIGDQSAVSDVRQASAFFRKSVLTVCLVASGLIVVGIASGAIDREVLLESPRSLRFRLMYWMGSSDLLVDNAVFGIGPGNFRNTYLQYKMADSSEQILDPHNLLLDTYCSAGLVGLIGLLLFVGTQFLNRVKAGPAGQAADQQMNRSIRGRVQQQQPVSHLRLFTAFAGYAFILFVVWEWFNGADLLSEFSRLPDGRFLVLVIPIAVVLFQRTLVQNWKVDRTAFRAAFATLLVHLLGAGAFQITAVGLILMCLHRGSGEWPSLAEDCGLRGGNGKIGATFCWTAMWNWGGILIFGGLAVAAVVSGLIPVRAAEWALNSSRMAEASGKSVLAVSVLEEGILADQLDVKLRQRKAELLAYSLIAEIAVQDDSAQSSKTILEESKRVLDSCDDWERSDSTGYRPFVLRSRVWEGLWQLQEDKEQLKFAIAQMNFAVERYPTSVEFLSRLALLQDSAGLNREAQTTASSALQQEEINRNWGHAELYLDDEVLEQLSQIVKRQP